LYCSFASAQPIPNATACVAPLATTGQPVRVRDHVGPSGFTAYASYDPDGWPAITYAPSYFTLPPTVQTFLSLHECGHLVLHTTNEFLANCYAVAQGNWNENQLALIARSHLTVGQLPAQYGGSGAAFWEGTKQTCPSYFQ
jgi:hypothetical protein